MYTIKKNNLVQPKAPNQNSLSHLLPPKKNFLPGTILTPTMNYFALLIVLVISEKERKNII